MPRPLHRAVRFFTLLLAAMQIALPAIVSVADGIAAHAAGQRTETHVGMPGNERGTPQHTADCQFCRFLNTSLVLTPGHAPDETATDVSRAHDAPGTLIAVAPEPGFNSRAPPTLPG